MVIRPKSNFAGLCIREWKSDEHLQVTNDKHVIYLSRPEVLPGEPISHAGAGFDDLSFCVVLTQWDEVNLANAVQPQMATDGHR